MACALALAGEPGVVRNAGARGGLSQPYRGARALVAGGRAPSNNTNFQIDSSTGVPGTPVNAEDQFGLDKTDYEAMIQAMVRVGRAAPVAIRLFFVGPTRPIPS